MPHFTPTQRAEMPIMKIVHCLMIAGKRLEVHADSSGSPSDPPIKWYELFPFMPPSWWRYLWNVDPSQLPGQRICGTLADAQELAGDVVDEHNLTTFVWDSQADIETNLRTLLGCLDDETSSS